MTEQQEQRDPGEGGRVVRFRPRSAPGTGTGTPGTVPQAPGTAAAEAATVPDGPGTGAVVGPVVHGELVEQDHVPAGGVPGGDGAVPPLPHDDGTDGTPAAEPGTDTEPVPVDTAEVAADTGTFLGIRHARLADARPIVHPVLRDRHEARQAARLIARYYAYMATFHTARTPLYAARLLAHAPRGTARLAARWAAWVTDAESRPVQAKAAAGADPQAWLLFSREHSRRVRPRRQQTALVGGAAVLVAAVAGATMPWWVLAAGLAGLLGALGACGGIPDQPVVTRFVSAELQRPLDSDEVVAALAAIGVKGTPKFVNPIQTDGPGWRAELDLPAGTLAEKVLEERSRLAGAMRRPLSTVWPETDPDAHPNRLVLWVAKQDPAKAKRRLWPLLKGGQVDLFTEIPFGFDPRGRMVPLKLLGTNVLIGGVMGSGKTSAVLVIALSGALDPTCELWVYEMKGSGDVESVKPICHRYVSGDEDEDCAAALAGLYALERELKRRKKLISKLPVSEVPQGRKVYPHLAARKELRLHPLLAIFDEAHTLFEHEVYGADAAAVAERLIKKARAYGIILVLTTQRPDASSIPKGVSDNAILRFCLAVTGHVANDLVLGTSMYKRGIRATMFDPQRDAGTGWLARSAVNAQIVRAAFIEQQEAADVARRALALRTAAGTLSGQAAGQAVEEVDTSTVVDHVRAVWLDGEDAMHSRDLVAALAVYRPETYGAWTQVEGKDEADTDAQRSKLLASALRPHGVPTGQVNRRGRGGNRKGVLRADLEAANGGAEPDEEG